MRIIDTMKDEVIKFQLPFELPGYSKDIEEIIIEECGNEYYGNLVIENYPKLVKIIVKNNSLNNLSSLNICNNGRLRVIKIGDCHNKNGTNSFTYVKSVTIESIVVNIIDSNIFLIYNHLKQELHLFI